MQLPRRLGEISGVDNTQEYIHLSSTIIHLHHL